MKHSQENIDNADIPSLLRWYMDSGVDEAIGDETLDWFSLSSPTTPKINTPVKGVPVISVEKTAEQAEKLAANCNTLEALREVIKEFDGCRLKKTATHTVFSDGNAQSNIMVIGEAPGVDEDRHGKPFVGEIGQLLDKMFNAINLNREKDFYLTNILPWRPPGNRSPTPDEIMICMPFIKRHMELFDPKLIILLGGISSNNLLNTTKGITKLRGKWAEYVLDGKKIPVRTLFHPGYLLHQPKAKGDTWKDLINIKAKIEELQL